MPKKKKKGLLADDKARIGYQEGEEVKTDEEISESPYERASNYVNIQFKKIVDDTENYNADDFGHTLGMIGSNSYYKSDEVEALIRKAAESYNKKITEHFTPNVANNLLFTEENIKDTLSGNYGIDRDLRAEGGLLSDDKARMAYAEGEEVAAEDEDMEGVAISISPVTATKEDIEQLETADTDETVSDEQMEQDHLDFIIDNALDEEDEVYLMEVLQADSRLSMIFDRVMDTASEFSGDGPVEGLGSEVSDSIPARLSDGEFVMTAKAADEIGPDNLQNMMDEAEEVSDNRQQAAQGGEIEDDKPIVSEFGKPVDEDIAEDEIKKGMLSVNPRLR